MSDTIVVPRVYRERETYMQRGWSKCKEQPLVPIGKSPLLPPRIFATCAALIGATKHLRSGDRTNFNRFLRFRVVAQGITVAACMAGTLVYGHYNRKDKEAELARDQAELAAYHATPNPVGPPPATAAQRRTEESIEELVARAEALEKAQARRPSARDTLMAALMKQKAEKAEWARQKEQAAEGENKQ